MTPEVLSATIIIACILGVFWAYRRKRSYDRGQPNSAYDVDGRLQNIICPNDNCGYSGAPKKENRGSTIVGLILCCFFLLPGIIYFILKSGYRYACPKCGMQIKADN